MESPQESKRNHEILSNFDTNTICSTEPLIVSTKHKHTRDLFLKR